MAMLGALAGASAGCGSHHAAATQGGDDAGDDLGFDAGTGPDGAPGEAAPPGDDAGEGGLVGDGGSISGCAPEAKLVYAVTEERELYSFDPATNVFSLVAGVDCAGGSYANSMTVDRSGTAWINYGDGSLWTVSTQKPGCHATGFIPNQQGVGLFGMAFTSKSPGSDAEQLYICDLSGGGLGFIDTSTLKLQRLGPFTGAFAGRNAELNGTGDARLFGFFAGSFLGDGGAATVAQVDPNTEGATQQWDLPTIDTGSDWAFSFYGGDFYLFTANKYDSNNPYTQVTRYRPSDGSLTVLVQSAGFRVVGAGSSTCAPTTPAQ